LSLTGTYKVTVSREGFGNEERDGLTLRSGETATIKVALLAGSQKAEVTVFGTAEGVRADAQIGLPLSEQTDRRDADPRPQSHHAAAAQLCVSTRQRATGDLFVNQTYFITGAGSRRATTVTLDGCEQRRRLGPPNGVAHDSASAQFRRLP
jgi:hypothetical protein